MKHSRKDDPGIRLARPTRSTWLLIAGAGFIGVDIVLVVSKDRFEVAMLVLILMCLCFAAGIMLERYGK